jgi:glycosyltransferase involved in cell wall biosynthesis
LQLAHCGHVAVLTRANNQSVIETAIPPGSNPNIKFFYYDPPRLFRTLKRGERGLYFYYLVWQFGAFLLAYRLCRTKKFDYAVALTFGSIWMPTFLQFLPIPFIWGPIGGGEAVPKGLLPALACKPRLLQRFRYVLFRTLAINPFVHHALAQACSILVRTHDTARLIPQRYAHKTQIVLETAMASDVLDAFAVPCEPPDKTATLRVIYTGRLIGLKNVASAVHAVAQCIDRGHDLTFDIYGDGPEKQALQRLCAELGITSRVVFHGTVPRKTVITSLSEADVYLFPSLKEGGVWSLMEAMAARLPVICIETSGMALIADRECGVLIPPTDLESLQQNLADGLTQLAQDPMARQKMGAAARRRIEEKFLWPQKGNLLRDLFDRLDEETARSAKQ